MLTSENRAVYSLGTLVTEGSLSLVFSNKTDNMYKSAKSCLWVLKGLRGNRAGSQDFAPHSRAMQ